MHKTATERLFDALEYLQKAEDMICDEAIVPDFEKLDELQGLIDCTMRDVRSVYNDLSKIFE